MDDLGEACVFALQHWSANFANALRDASGQPLPFLNVGTGIDLSIREIAKQIAEIVGFEGRIDWDTSKPDGTPKKQLFVFRFARLGWTSSIPLEQVWPLRTRISNSHWSGIVCELSFSSSRSGMLAVFRCHMVFSKRTSRFIFIRVCLTEMIR